jgi:hypothetical protein
MTSTVLDVTVLLLCVSASVVILGGVDTDPTSTERTAADAADRLVTETATVRYVTDAERNKTRSVHATLIELLIAAATVEPDTDTTAVRFRSLALEAVTDALGPRTRVDVRRSIRPGDRAASTADATDDETVTVVGTDATSVSNGDGSTTVVSVGPSPPPDADVSAAVVRHPTASRGDGGESRQVVVRVWDR